MLDKLDLFWSEYIWWVRNLKKRSGSGAGTRLALNTRKPREHGAPCHRTRPDRKKRPPTNSTARWSGETPGTTLSNSTPPNATRLEAIATRVEPWEVIYTIETADLETGRTKREVYN